MFQFPSFLLRASLFYIHLSESGSLLIYDIRGNFFHIRTINHESVTVSATSNSDLMYLREINERFFDWSIIVIVEINK